MLEARLGELSPPVGTRLVAFDRAAVTLLPIADIVRSTVPEREQATIAHIVERVSTGDRAVQGNDIQPRMEAAPLP